MSFRSLLLLGLLTTLVACNPVAVKRTGGSSDDLSGYQSYRWNLPPLDDPTKYADNAVLLDVAVRREVGGQMAARGFQQQAHDNSQAELVLDYRLQFTPESFASDQPQDYGLVWQRGEQGDVKMSRNRPAGDPDITLERATLLMTVYNSDKSQVLWEVSANRLLEQGRDPSQINEAIGKVVAKMYKEFPMGQR